MCKSIIDIRADHIHTKLQEKVWEVQITITDHQFYDQQCMDGQPGYCGTFVDKKWQLTMMRKKHADNVTKIKRKAPGTILLLSCWPSNDDIKNVICCYR